MPAHVIVGAQWGDEGKGRVADYFAARAEIVARYAGGDNAGHTVRVRDQTFKLHIVPSGALHDGVVCVMGSGMVVNPVKLAEELKGLELLGVDISPARMLLSEHAHLITPMHIALDKAQETIRGAEKIGTTARGIGPAYTDKVTRIGLRTGLLQDQSRLESALRSHVEWHNLTLERILNAPPLDPDSVCQQMLETAEFLAPYLADTGLYLHEALIDGKRVLCEGAQGTQLDIDHGLYPFVTSSSATAGGAVTGLGIGPRFITRVTGVMKAFSTRVGSGPFPTEQEGEIGARLRGTGENPWDEYGTTTGRARRCGWLDTVVVRYAARINGLTDLIMTKLDVLSGLESLQIADSYHYQGRVIQNPPHQLEAIEASTPRYLTLKGWSEDIMDETAYKELPESARTYVEQVERLIGLPVTQVTVGPGRDQAINRDGVHAGYA